MQFLEWPLESVSKSELSNTDFHQFSATYQSLGHGSSSVSRYPQLSFLASSQPRYITLPAYPEFAHRTSSPWQMTEGVAALL